MGRPESASGRVVDEVIEQALAHHGVKGMKWGVRHDPGHVGERAKTKTIAKADKKFEKTISTANAGRITLEFHNAAVSRINARIRDINDSPKYRSKHMDRATGKIKEEYNRDMQKAIVSSFEDATREVYGSNASGTKMGVFNAKEDRIDIVDKVAKHADSPPQVPDVSVLLTRNKTGHVVGIKIVPLKEEGQLAHYGVKGMHWGVRRSPEQIAAGRKVVATTRPGKKVKTSGGKHLMPSEDAVIAAVHRQRAKASSVDALTNQQLQLVVTRMNLEKQYSQLTSSKKTRSEGLKLAEDVLKEVKDIHFRDLHDNVRRNRTPSRTYAYQVVPSRAIG